MTTGDERQIEYIHRYEELLASLSDPTVLSDQARYRKLSIELSELEPIVSCYRELQDKRSAFEDARTLFNEADDEELKEMAREEMNAFSDNIRDLEARMTELTAPKDPNDDKSVIIEIRAGAGGEEAALFCGVLYGMYSAYALSRGWTVEDIDSNQTELGGYKEIVFSIEGKGAYSRFKYESGVHRVQRVPVTESSGRIHTSTVTVAVLPEAEAVEIDISPNDLRIDTFRASGAGGQHINKTDSAIRITHLPTGLVVQCQDQRSQYKNKDKAMAVLMSRLKEQASSRQQGEIASDRKSQVGTGDRSERIRTYNYHQGRVSDHRIGLTLYRLEEILAGDIDEIINALAAADKLDQMMNGSDDEDGAND
ncbi:MAG: peptide chain release factor 1 [Oscillospiraceae bacterium]|nr:peptide chain release factor 1 [Oscillospiraceae bacterium]